ncbi:MAG TPA: peptidase M48 [Acidaminococcaceae bacterium]|nr:peptidase M48 [Acidaminococcaceae bacterium]
MIGEEREIEMGRAAGQQLEREYGVYQDPGQQARLERIGRSLAAQCERRNLPFQFKILNTPEVNALACPGGFIYVFKGLLDYMPDDAELAGVLGHEIGHVAKRHTVKQIEKNMWTQMASILAGIATGSADVMMAGMVVTDALAAGYSRADESAADRCGFEYALKAGYSPYGILITMYKLQQLSGEYGNPGWGLFDSHPEPEERVRRMKGLLETLQVTPQPVANADGTADVVETHDGRTWRFTFTGPANGNKAEYRADILAGALYQVKRRGPVQPERFIVYDRGGEATVFYDDLQLLTVTKQDAGSRSPADYAKQAAAGFREWAVLANAERAGNPQAFTIDPFSKKDRNKEKGKEKGNGKEKDTDRKTGVTKNVQAK